MIFFLSLGYNPHCIVSLGIATNGPTRSRRGCYLPNVETERDASARHASPHLVFHILAFLGICIIEPLLHIHGFHLLGLNFYIPLSLIHPFYYFFCLYWWYWKNNVPLWVHLCRRYKLAWWLENHDIFAVPEVVNC